MVRRPSKLEKRSLAMRILIIQPWIRLGGAELISIHLAHQLREQGHRAAIICTFVDRDGMPEQAHKVNYLLPPRWLTGLCKQSKFFFFVSSPWILLALVWKNSVNADVLNPHNFPSSWVAVIVGKLRHIPVVWTCNEPPTRVPWADALHTGLGDFIGWFLATSWLDKRFVKQTSMIYVPSEKTWQQVLARYGLNAAVIPLGVEAEQFANPTPDELAMKHDLEAELVLLTVGKLHPQKNQIVSLKTLKKVLVEIPDTILVLAGNGPTAPTLQRYANKWGIADRVRFLGHTNASDVRDLYGACDINLVPAINQSWGLTPFEALCSGTISIVSSDCGAAELLDQENIGIVS